MKLGPVIVIAIMLSFLLAAENVRAESAWSSSLDFDAGTKKDTGTRNDYQTFPDGAVLLANRGNYTGISSGVHAGSTSISSSGLTMAYNMETNAILARQVTGFSITSMSGGLGTNQGVGSDGAFLYATTNNNWLAKFTLAYVKVAERYAIGDAPVGMQQVNSVSVHGGRVYVSVTNYPTSPGLGYIMEYDTNLNFITVHTVEFKWSEGACYAQNSFWVVYENERMISRYSNSWSFVADYPLSYVSVYSPSGTPGIGEGYQGCTWDGDYLYLSIHDTRTDTGLIHVYKWTGSGFARSQKMKSVTYWSTQGFSFLDGRGYFSERNAFAINGTFQSRIITADLVYGTSSGDMLNDFSGSGNHGWFNTTAHPASASGKFGSARVFNNDPLDYFQVDDYAPLQSWSSMSIAALVKYGSAQNTQIVSKTAGGTDGDWLLSVLSTPAVRIATINAASVRVNLDVNFNYADNNWHWFVGTYDGSAMHLYIDGVLRGNATQTGVLKNHHDHVRVGRFNGTSQYAIGTFDELLIFKNRVLSGSDVTALFLDGRFVFRLAGTWTSQITTSGTEWPSEIRIGFNQVTSGNYISSVSLLGSKNEVLFSDDTDLTYGVSHTYLLNDVRTSRWTVRVALAGNGTATPALLEVRVLTFLPDSPVALVLNVFPLAMFMAVLVTTIALAIKFKRWREAAR